MSFSSNKKQLLRWVGWFTFINVLIAVAVQLTYLRFLPSLQAIYGATTANITLASAFLASSYVAHAALMCGLCALIPLMLAYCGVKRWWVMILAALFMTVLMTGMVIDNIAYSLYHSHQIAVGMIIIKAGAVNEEMPLSVVEYVALGVVIGLIVSVEALIATLVWRRLQKNRVSKSWGKACGAFLGLCIVCSYGLMAFVVTVPKADRFNEPTAHLLLKMARLVPYYQTMYTLLVPGSETTTHHIALAQGDVPLQTQLVNRPLQYPLHPLQCHVPNKKPNILFLVIDTLRYDALTPKVMPHLSAFAKQTQQFDLAYSGGNCTRPGVFSMFYGLPANYWQAMLMQHRGPVLIDELQKANYQMGIFASATMKFPQFAKTVFVNVKNMQDTEGETSVARDVGITQRFKQFLATRDQKRPFFSFLFYDAVHNYCEGSEQEHQNPFHPAAKECKRFSLTQNTDPIPYINRYHNAAYFIDGEANKVLMALRQRGLLKNTIVVITADHGEQFNDEHMDYWSHASAYTPYQLHIPFLVYWPGKAPQHYRYFVTNHDLAPTILQKVLACRNPTSDYASGHSLFQAGNRPYLIAGSYTDYAVVTNREITRVYTNGDYTLNNPTGHHLYRSVLSAKLLKQTYAELTRFFR